MPKPIKRRELIRRFRALGWVGPESGHRHLAMRRGQKTVPIPNPHGSGDLDWSLVKRILRDAGIEPAEWERV
jgi:predicted RNA binding protein YcfA (HicA-like mRNA interferase family)